MSGNAAVRVIVYGRVQGVYFRAFAIRQAARLGLTGYVRNLPDGTVELHAEGKTDNLRRLLDRLRAGPPAARVDKINTRWSEYTGDYTSFNVSSQQ